MKSEVRILTPSWRVTITVGLTAAAVLITAMFVFRDEFRLAIRFVLVVAGMVVLIFTYGWYKRAAYLSKAQHLDYLIKREEFRQMQLSNNRLELQSRFLVIGRTERAVYYEPDGIRIIDAVPQVVSQRRALPPPGDEQQTIYDAVAAVRNAQAGVSIVGPQQSSKTNLAMSAAYQHYQAGLPVIVIGYRYEPEFYWPGLEAYYRGRTHQGLERVMALYRSGPVDQPTMVVFNDWLNIVAVAKDLADELFIEAATQFISHNIIPVFTLQSDSRGDWGISDNGARLKDNFLKIEIPAPVRDAQMNVIGYPQKAAMYMPGDRRNSSIVNLPGRFRPVGSAPAVALPEFESEEETRIYYILADDPTVSNYRICQDVWGKQGSSYVDKINRVKERYGPF